MAVATAVQQDQDVTLPERFQHALGAETPAARQLRRSLVLSALRHIPPEQAWLVPGSRTHGLVTATDLAWLLSLGATEWAAHAAGLIPLVFERTDAEQQELVWAHKGEPIFDDSVGPWFDAVEIDSPTADRMRRAYERSLRRDRLWEGAAMHESALDAAWARCVQGEPEGFLALCDRLRADPKTGRVTHNDDLVSWPGYPLITVDETVLQTVAERYLTSEDAGGDAWVDKPGTLPFRAFVGYVALAYLARRNDGNARLDALPEQAWQRWTPTVLWLFDELGDPAIRATLKDKAQQHAPDSYRQWALRRVEVQVQADRSLDSLDDVEASYDDVVGDRLDVVLRRAVDAVTDTAADLGQLTHPVVDAPQQPRPSENDLRSRLSTACGNAAQLARFLLRHREETRVWVRGLADCTTSTSIEARVLATEVLLAAGLLGWDDVLTSMQSDEGFGEALVVALARQRGDEVALPQLTDLQLTELCGGSTRDGAARPTPSPTASSPTSRRSGTGATASSPNCGQEPHPMRWRRWPDSSPAAPTTTASRRRLPTPKPATTTTAGRVSRSRS
jgi:hypothetical protein